MSCKNDNLVIPITEDPKLNVNFNLNSEDVSLVAGLEGYYMTTYYIEDIDSSSAYGVGQFAGKMHHFEDEFHKEAIEVRIRNSHSGAILSGDLDQILQSESLEYYGLKEEVFYEVIFNLTAFPLSPQPDSVIWNFGDGAKGKGFSPTHLYKKGIQDKFRVCVGIYRQGCQENEICSDVIPFSANCDAAITADTDSLRNVIFSAVNVTGKTPFSYVWTFENGLKFNTAEVKFVYGLSDSFIEHARLDVMDATGCTSHVEFKYNVGNSLDCYSNFDYIRNGEVTTIDILGYNEAELIYWDEQGNTFSTSLGQQNPNNFFRILNHGAFMLNYDQLPTKYLDIEFKCDLFDLQGNVLNFNSGKGRIALAYPR